MNNITSFLTKQNIQILWDVLLDEICIDINNKQLVSNIRTVFESNINPFTSRSPQNSTLVDLNKQFLSQVVIAVNRLFPGLKQEQELKRINISSEEVQIQDPYKIEDILATRQTNFEKQVKQKQLEFDNSINLQRPKELDFSEKIEDGKIKEMDALIAETIARRKFEVEQYKPILNTNTNANANTNTNTNLNILEEEQSQSQKQIDNLEMDINRKLKYINIDNTNNITLNEMTSNKKNINQYKKKVSWIENKLTNDLGSEFKLTKPILAPIVINNNSINDFSEQIIDLHELNRKYDLLNNKMDTLIDLVSKLTNQLEKKEYNMENINI